MTGITSPGHLVILLVVLLLVFGAKRLPELGRSLGHGMREFKDSVNLDPAERRAEAPAAPTLTPVPEPEREPVATVPDDREA